MYDRTRHHSLRAVDAIFTVDSADISDGCGMWRCGARLWHHHEVRDE